MVEINQPELETESQLQAITTTTGTHATNDMPHKHSNEELTTSISPSASTPDLSVDSSSLPEPQVDTTSEEAKNQTSQINAATPSTVTTTPQPEATNQPQTNSDPQPQVASQAPTEPEATPQTIPIEIKSTEQPAATLSSPAPIATSNAIGGNAPSGSISNVKTAATASQPEPQRVHAEPDNEYLEIAKKLFDEEFVSIQPEEYIQFLASKDPESAKIRNYYMSLFSWPANLLSSTRMLCSKLYLKGESQEIDRILTSFTQSYLRQHPQNIFCTKSFEQIYVIIYSLILLNTALHNLELNKKSKISQTDFIKNTYSTFLQQNPSLVKSLSIKQRYAMEKELSNFYEDLSRTELHLKTGSNDENTVQMTRRMSKKEQSRNVSSGTVSQAPPQPLGNTNTTNATTIIGETTTTTNVGATANEQQHYSMELTRQRSSSSIWSNDGLDHIIYRSRTNSSTTSSSPQQYHYHQQQQPQDQRVGLARVLASDTAQLRRQGKSTTASILSSSNNTSHIRTRVSMDNVRGSNGAIQGRNSVAVERLQQLNHQGSRISLISRDSNFSQFDDAISELTFDSESIAYDGDQELGDHVAAGAGMSGEGNQRTIMLDDFQARNYQDDYDLTLELRGSPYLKEGLLWLKILNNDMQDESLVSTQEGNEHGGDSIISSATTHSLLARFFSFFKRKHTGSASNGSIAGGNSGNNGESGETMGTHHQLSTHLTNKFTEHFVVVSKGVLALYSFDPKLVKKQQQKMKAKRRFGIGGNNHQSHHIQPEDDQEYDNVGDGNWLKNAAKIGTYNLCSTHAHLERFASSSKPTWVLTFPQTSKKPAKKFIFEAGTEEIALEYVNACNFWAAKITAIPTLEETVSSIEYGWNNLDMLIAHRESFKKDKNIAKWEPLIKGVYLSNYIVNGDDAVSHVGMMKQFVKTSKYYNNLRKLYKDFLQSRLKFVSNLPRAQYHCSNYSKVLHNFDLKIKDYKNELMKYKSYVIVLAFGLQLRFDLEDEDRSEDSDGTVIERGQTIDGVDCDNVDENIDDDDEDDDEFTKLVKREIKKLFTSMKDVPKVIASYQSSKTISQFVEMAAKNELQRQEMYLQKIATNDSASLVKSPKTFTLSELQGTESPIKQLMASSNKAQPVTGLTYLTMEEIPEEELDREATKDTSVVII